jgi:hypothetical protein
MEFTIKIPDSVFRTAKTPEQAAEEVRQAAAIFWVARGDVAPEAVSEITTPSPPATSSPEKKGTLYDLLMEGPNVGEDADFERPLDYGRPIVELD